LDILISGAGIGGLSAALCLLKSGHSVRIFEQAAAFNNLGAGIQCGANALRVFDYLDLLSEIEALSVEPKRAEFRDYKTGDILYQIPFGKDYRRLYKAPYLHIHRSDLHQILLNAVARLAPQALEMNSKVIQVEETSNNVNITLSDQRSISGDCLIACDGIKSSIRSKLFAQTPARFTGNVAWRGVLPTEQLPENFMDAVVSNFVGPDKHMVIYYLRKQQLVNFIGVVENSNWTDDSWVSKSPWEELQSDFAGWHPSVQSIINAMDKEQCFRWALYDHAPLKNWSTQRITLLGDAAHATLPFMASGAAIAIEDARILQRSLDQTENLSDGLQMYQRNRLKRTTKVQNISKQAGKLYHINNRLLQKAAFKALSLRSNSANAFLPEYDANTIELI